jgi:hypothetical protein
MGRVCDAPTPRALKNLHIVIGHDHLGPKVSIDNAVINLHGVIYDTLNMQVRNLWPGHVHGCPHNILDQNSAMFKDGTDLWGRRVPMSHVLKAHVYDAPNSFIVFVT